MVSVTCYFFFFQAEDGIRDVAVTGVQTCALPIFAGEVLGARRQALSPHAADPRRAVAGDDRRVLAVRADADIGAVALGEHVEDRSEEHTSELQSRLHLVCRLLLEKKKMYVGAPTTSTNFPHTMGALQSGPTATNQSSFIHVNPALTTRTTRRRWPCIVAATARLVC